MPRTCPTCRSLRRMFVMLTLGAVASMMIGSHAETIKALSDALHGMLAPSLVLGGIAILIRVQLYRASRR